LDLDDDDDIESNGNLISSPQMSSSADSTPHRFKLNLPPPKNSETTGNNLDEDDDDKDVKGDPETKQRELDLLQSVMSGSSSEPQTLESGLSFVIDNLDVPEAKKPRKS